MRTEHLLTQTKRSLRKLGLRARKGLGQHFLVDEAVLNVIIEAAELAETDAVIEVGPGLGVLTERLARHAGGARRVIAVELDERLAAALAEGLADFSNITVVHGDILSMQPDTLLRDAGGGPEYEVVANLPYYITSPVLRHFLEVPPRPRRMVVMVQNEVAEAIAAPPGRMSLLSVSVQFYGEPTVISHVPARCFYPEPEVDSAVLRIEVSPQPRVSVSDEAGFFKLVRAGFSASRKQLANSLANGLGLPKAEAVSLLDGCGVEPRRRAETLTLEEWARLWETYAGTGRG